MNSIVHLEVTNQAKILLLICFIFFKNSSVLIGEIKIYSLLISFISNLSNEKAGALWGLFVLVILTMSLISMVLL